MTGQNLSERLSWGAIQDHIAGCRECTAGKSHLVAMPLQVAEIPDPPGAIDTLFIGVAPPALNGKHKGRHFWSNATDPLRLGLFGLLDSLLGSDLKALNHRSKDAADDAFRARRFFFVHSCKVRPVPADLKAPPNEVIASCARRHLLSELVALNPRTVCFLGHNTASAATLLGLTIDDRIATARAISAGGEWSGLAMATVQPIRGAERRAGPAIRLLLATAGLLQ